MPAYKYHGMLCYFAVFKDHYSLFVSPKVIEAFYNRLTTYKLTKSAVKIRLDEPVPVKLVKEVIRNGGKENLVKAILKDAAKNKAKKK
jgi:uncharacterized protein YdhG (YjbR/CyaY superfamily)